MIKDIKKMIKNEREKEIDKKRGKKEIENKKTSLSASGRFFL